ncbi:31294_t:CDS:2, partial [Racocetra persica]
MGYPGYNLSQLLEMCWNHRETREWRNDILARFLHHPNLTPSKYRPNALYDAFSKADALGPEHILAINVKILDQANPLGTVSNLPLTNPKEASQSTGISPLMGETFVLSSPPIRIPPIRMEGIEDTATQQVKSNL